MKLEPKDLDLIKGIFKRQLSSLPNRAFIFGSRATGEAHRYSDIDIGISGPRLSAERYFDILAELEESPLEYLVHLVQFDDVGESFKKIAEQQIIPLN